jgi:putative two-component system response regulator
MTLLDLHSAPVEIRTRTQLSQQLKWATFRNRIRNRISALSDASLRKPWVPSLLFGTSLHLCQLGFHLYQTQTFAGFFPSTAWGWLAWLPEYLGPYFALKFFAIAHRHAQEAWQTKVSEGLDRTQELQKVSILGFAKMSEVRDPDTGDHIVRMSHYSRILAEELGKVPAYQEYISRQYCEEIFLSAPLHDIGKVGILDHVLKKRGPLTAEEFEMMKMHTILGGDLLNELELKLGFQTFYSLGKQIAYHHHQRFDGTGYPNVLGSSQALFVDNGIGRPLKGNEIPLSARIVSLADVYDALISRRCYKEPIPHSKAREMILEDSGKRFDPEVVAAFQRCENHLIEVGDQFSR